MPAPAALRSLDDRLLIAARRSGHTPARDRAVAAFSKTGEHAACWLAFGTAMSFADRSAQRRGAWRVDTATVAASYVINTALKFVVRRPRPQLPGLPPLTSTVSRLSFPSAHATSAFTAAGLYGRLIPAAPLYGLATAFALSRLYLGVHYPSDVLAGALLGTGVARCR